MRTRTIRQLLLVGLLHVLASGCAMQSDLMATDERPVTEPEPDEARIVFMRPSLYGGAIQASVFNTTDGETDFVGIASAQSAIETTVEPGRHHFMVVSEAADFMRAEVEGGRTYYAIVEPRAGFSVRFSLIPVKAASSAEYTLDSAEFEQWREDMQRTRTTPEAEQWARDNRDDTLQKQEAYWEKWQSKPAADKAKVTLEPADGV